MLDPNQIDWSSVFDDADDDGSIVALGSMDVSMYVFDLPKMRLQHMYSSCEKLWLLIHFKYVLEIPIFRFNFSVLGAVIAMDFRV